MPRDLVALETKPDLTVPTLAGLAWLLRHPAEWPKDHIWDFGTFLLRAEDFKVWGDLSPAPNCGTVGCAGGLAWLMWGGDEDGLSKGYIPFSIDVSMMNMFDMDYGASREIFTRGVHSNPPITATHVADRIDDYLAGRPIRA